MKTKNKIILFNLLYVIFTTFLIIVFYNKLNAFKIDTFTTLFLIYRHVNASFLKVGLANVGNIFHLSKNNRVEVIYMFTTLICIIPAWLGSFILYGNISIDVYDQYILIWVLILITMFMDIFLYHIRKRTDSGLKIKQ